MATTKTRWLRGNRQRVQRLSDRLRELRQLTAQAGATPEELFDAYLTAGYRLFGLSMGGVGRVEGDDYHLVAVLGHLPGLTVDRHFPLGDTYCSRVIEAGAGVAYLDVDALESPPVSSHLGVRPECYIGAPILVNGELWGCLHFFDLPPKTRHFGTADLEFLELMAQSLGGALERREAEARLREKERRFEIAFERAPIGMAIINPDGQWVQVNRAFCQLVGYDREELLATGFADITHPDDLAISREYARRALAGEFDTYRLEKRYLHKQGHPVWVLLSVALVRTEGGEPLYFIDHIQDITDRKYFEEELHSQAEALALANHRLKALARTDPLTGLANRRAFAERLAEARARSVRAGAPLSLLMLDVDNFKAYNDRFGHQAGDAVLVQVGEVLTYAARASDFVARYGGEEFVAILPDTDAEGAKRVAERFRAAIEAATWPGRAITASFGATTLQPGEGREGEHQELVLLAEADAAMYRAKQAGRNRVSHYADEA